MGLDAGPESCKLFRKTILASKTILWNGPAGVFEFDAFANGSKTTLDACIEAKEGGATVMCVVVALQEHAVADAARFAASVEETPRLCAPSTELRRSSAMSPPVEVRCLFRAYAKDC